MSNSLHIFIQDNVFKDIDIKINIKSMNGMSYQYIKWTLPSEFYVNEEYEFECIAVYEDNTTLTLHDKYEFLSDNSDVATVDKNKINTKSVGDFRILCQTLSDELSVQILSDTLYVTDIDNQGE